MQARRQAHGFTLIELLVVIAVLTVLMAFLLPALRQALFSSRTASCASNEKQIYMAMALYMEESRGTIPWNDSTAPGLSVYERIGIYLGGGSPAQNVRRLDCPQDRWMAVKPGSYGTILRGGTYGISSYVAGKMVHTLKGNRICMGEGSRADGAKTIWWAAGDDAYNQYHPWAHNGGEGPLVAKGGSNYLYTLGNVRYWPFEPYSTNTYAAHKNKAVTNEW